MFKSISPDALRDVTCPYDGDPKTVFTILESLPFGIRSEIKDRFSRYSREAESKTVQYEYQFGARSIEIVRHGLKRLKNLTDAKGSPIECKLIRDLTHEVVDPAVLQALSIPVGKDGFDTVLDWLASEIWKGTELAEDEVKVFPTQSGS